VVVHINNEAGFIFLHDFIFDEKPEIKASIVLIVYSHSTISTKNNIL
jgi:hypothetical protein